MGYRYGFGFQFCSILERAEPKTEPNVFSSVQFLCILVRFLCISVRVCFNSGFLGRFDSVWLVFKPRLTALVVCFKLKVVLEYMTIRV